jgi:hypothetical protein
MAHQLLSCRFGITHKRSPDASLYLTHQSEHKTPTQQAAAGPVSKSASLGSEVEDLPVEVLCMSSVQSAHPPTVRVSNRAQAELRADEALVFDWTGLAFCCAVAGEISLRPTTLQEAQRSSVYVPLRSGDGPLVFAHRRAYPMLVGRDIEIDCRRRLGVRSFSSSLPPDLGLRTSFGRETGDRSRDRREGPASGAAAPLN